MKEIEAFQLISSDSFPIRLPNLYGLRNADRNQFQMAMLEISRLCPFLSGEVSHELHMTMRLTKIEKQPKPLIGVAIANARLSKSSWHPF